MLTGLRDLLRKARFLLLRDRVERDIDRELHFHIDLRTRENLESGMAWRDARKDAVKRFGNMAYIKENCRDERGSGFVEVLLQDLRIGAMMLGKSPVFSLVIIVTLAVGIGANSLIFSVVNAVLINGLPYKDSDRLVQFWEKSPIKHWDYNVCSPANYLDWKSQNQSFQDMAAYMGSNGRGPGVHDIALTRAGASETVHGLLVTGELFSVLGANAMLGRTFTAEETWEGHSSVAVLSYNLWKSRFGGDARIIGQQIQLDGLSYTVVGVMPPPFYFPSREVELWAPMAWSQNVASVRRPHFLRVIGRLKDGVPLEKARADVVGIAANLEKQYPDTNTKMGVGLGPFKEWIVQETRPALLIFLAAVAFVLLIACANIANLLLSRSASRAKEMAVRAALGAGKFRLTRQLLTECLMLAAAGGGLGLILAVAGRRLLVAFNPGNIPRFDDISLDWRVIAFTVGVSAISVLLFGLVPALAVSRPDLVAVLKEGGRSVGLGVQGTRARRVMVVAEVALSTLLVISAGLMIRSFARLQRVAPGFVASDLLTFKLSLPAKYKTDSQVNGFFDDVLRRMNALPGVQSAAAITSLPLTGTTWTGDFTIEGRPAGEYGVEVRHESVTPDYFKTVETPLVSGRWFTDADNDPKNQVIIINQALAIRYFQNEDPVGKRLKPSKPTVQSPWQTIVGVVGNERQDSLRAQAMPGIYDPFALNPFNQMSLVIRTAPGRDGAAGNDPKALLDFVREQIRAVDPDVPPFDVLTMKDVVYRSAAGDRFSLLLLATFAGIALVLAAVGIYGVISYSVNQQTHEIGIRMALGAGGRDVLTMVVGQGIGLTAIGLGIGLAGALALTRLMAGLLFGITAQDPATFVVVAVALACVAVFACAVPARRATRVDPMTALHYE